MQWSDSDSDDKPEERVVKHEDSDDEEDDSEFESIAAVEMRMKAVMSREADLINPNSKISLKLRRIGELRNLEFLDLSQVLIYLILLPLLLLLSNPPFS
jgi:hypothetical protein